MLNKNEIIKKWNDLSLEDKHALSLLAGVSAGLFLRGIIKYLTKNGEVITITVPSGAEVNIFLGDDIQ